MKLNKSLKKTVLVAMTVLAAAALTFTGCSNGSDDDPITGPTPTGDSGSALGLSTMDGWGKYDVSNKTDSGVTIISTGVQTLNDCCGADIAFGSTKKVTFTVTNNANEECWVQVLVKKDGSTSPASGGRVSTATIDGTDCGDVTWGANTTIAAGASKNFVLNLTGTDADKFVFSLNSNSDSLSKSSGNITISNALKYN